MGLIQELQELGKELPNFRVLQSGKFVHAVCDLPDGERLSVSMSGEMPSAPEIVDGLRRVASNPELWPEKR